MAVESGRIPRAFQQQQQNKTEIKKKTTVNEPTAFDDDRIKERKQKEMEKLFRCRVWTHPPYFNLSPSSSSPEEEEESKRKKKNSLRCC